MVVRDVGVAFLKFSTLLYGHENGSSVFEFCAFAQVVIALTGRELVYFEMDPSGQLNEYTERKEMGADIICMALGPVTTTDQRSRFLAVGLADNTVRIISLDPSVSSNRLLCHAWLCSAQILLVQIRMQQWTVQVQCMCVTFVCVYVFSPPGYSPASQHAGLASSGRVSVHLATWWKLRRPRGSWWQSHGNILLECWLAGERERKREGERESGQRVRVREREWERESERERVREREGVKVHTLSQRVREWEREWEREKVYLHYSNLLTWVVQYWITTC